MAQEVVAASDAENGKAGLSKGGNKVGTGDGEDSGSCRDGHSLNSDEFQILFRRALDFQTQFYGFANALDDLVEGPRLRIASGHLRNRGYVIAFRVALNHDIELTWHWLCPCLPL